MKIRKILPLLALAVLAVFALSSCDAMLESLFPEETGKLSTQGSNSISVQAEVYWYYLANPGLGKLRIELWDATFVDPIEVRIFDVYYTGYDVIYYSADFSFLVDGQYYITAYVDVNGNGYFDDINWGANFDPVWVDAATSHVDKVYSVW